MAEQWDCQKCGRKGGFKLMGKGFIMCTGCGTWHIVSSSGQVHRVGESTPWLIGWLHN